jgi:hypothetical protein
MAKKNNASEKDKEGLSNSELIQQQTEAFLRAGGKINVVENGVTGYDNKKSNKHITISSKREKTDSTA